MQSARTEGEPNNPSSIREIGLTGDEKPPRSTSSRRGNGLEFVHELIEYTLHWHKIQSPTGNSDCIADIEETIGSGLRSHCYSGIKRSCSGTVARNLRANSALYWSSSSFTRS
jgi:hypothetical protein